LTCSYGNRCRSQLILRWIAYVEVLAGVEVGDESGLHGMPSHHSLGDGARAGEVEGEEGTQETEMGVGLLARDGSHRHIQMPADDLGDFSDGNPFLSHTMQSGTRRGGFQGQAKEMRRVQPVHRGPPVGAIARVGRHALGPRDVYEDRAKPVIATAVHGAWIR